MERWHDSGLSAEQFAAELGISAATLKAWKYKLGHRALAASPMRKFRETTAPVIEILETTSSRVRHGFELELKGGRRLHIPSDFDAPALGRLLTILERA